MNTANRKLFEETLCLYGREYSLVVFAMFNANQTNYYRCILDGIKILDLWINDDGHWIDMENGPSELCEKIGSIIERRMLPQEKKRPLIYKPYSPHYLN